MPDSDIRVLQGVFPDESLEWLEDAMCGIEIEDNFEFPVDEFEDLCGQWREFMAGFAGYVAAEMSAGGKVVDHEKDQSGAYQRDQTVKGDAFPSSR
jgi:hypothetical protein